MRVRQTLSSSTPAALFTMQRKRVSRRILEMSELKKEGRLKALIVTGCLAQRYQQEIIDEIPEVDAVLGTTSYDKILDAVDEALEGHHYLKMTDIDALPTVDSKRLVTTGGHFAYLKIAEGCDKHCTYCIIPKIRGNFRQCSDGTAGS